MYSLNNTVKSIIFLGIKEVHESFSLRFQRLEQR